ncbi:kelch-like protein 9 [Polyodon spathula]|uniref:kelch-like protein 9 n=1 Tax=Polyodon spathula TaxID=7913 RepID=UPI001B7EE99D|nr:kelch-like protein 9 [Polyodon spathula]
MDNGLQPSAVAGAYPLRLLEGASSLRAQNALCDVTLEADGVAFPAHKVILASASSYCRVLFIGNAVNPEANNVKLKDVSARGLKQVLDFIYTSKLELSRSSLEDTLKAAEILLVRDAIKLCFKFLEENLNQENCLEVLNIAKKFCPDELRQKAASYVGRQYKTILQDRQQLVELDEDTLRDILNKSELCEYSELELFDCVMTWLRHDKERIKAARDLLKRIRFPLISADDLQKFVQETSVMKTDSECFSYLQDALRYHSQLYAQPALQSQKTQIRSDSENLLVLGGRTSDNKVCSDIWAADEECSGWKKLGELCAPVYNHCAVVIGNFLFVIGGQYKFEAAGKQPTNEVAGMLEKRTRFHAGVLSDHIIAVAGGTLLGNLTNTVEEYRPTDNKWAFTAPFPLAVADHAGTTHKGILYISGGFSAGQSLNDLYSYLPRLKRWVINRPMTFPRCDHGMATVDNKIFCLDDWVHVNETEYYCPESDQWTTLKVSPFDCSQFSLIAHGSKLYIAGGGSLREMNKKEV